ncbi:hypothetical protein J5N97_019685 [Dioscorea zingiberensis]|uniref:PH domain-containing protein n=1 Tax=Dioscorea zingiberensis TaxID=325984 RepID=A0A9D5CEG3_9LILI|nr:hypothetical protein J5N97_019685 [Dioscorea zingiberensis]
MKDPFEAAVEEQESPPESPIPPEDEVAVPAEGEEEEADVRAVPEAPSSAPPSASAGAGGGARGKEEEEEEEEENMGVELGKFPATGDPDKMAKMQAILSQFTEEQMSRYESFRRSGFQKSNMKRLLASIIGSQKISIPMTIVVSGIAKMFVGELIETARIVMTERADTGLLVVIQGFGVLWHMIVQLTENDAHHHQTKRNTFPSDDPKLAGIQRGQFPGDQGERRHFQASKATDDCLQSRNQKTDHSLRSYSHSWVGRRVMGAASMLNLFSLPRLPWQYGSNDDYKIVITKAEVESLRSEIADVEERESHLKAQLEHVDEVLKSARLCGYLHMRTRWTELPGEPPIIDDADVDDWLPRFVVLQGTSIFYYLKSTDLSPQDTTLLSDVVEVGLLPSFMKDDQQERHAFYILTCHGLRFECSTISKVQVESWFGALQKDCNTELDSILRNKNK